MTRMFDTLINGRWDLKLPEHRAGRPEWPWWEAQRLAAMHYVVKAMHQRMWHNHGERPLIVDVGAEEGDLSALYSLWGADVALFEPNDKVWPNIKAIWEANNLRLPVLCIDGFAADHTGVFTDNTLDGVWPEAAYGQVISDHGFLNLSERPDIQRVRLDDVGLSRRVDVITIDVEGAELRVLRGAEDLLRNDKPVVFCSVHREFMIDMYANFPAELFGYMSELGYECRFLCKDHEEHWIFQHPDNKWMET